jgi:hypothetical protein
MRWPLKGLEAIATMRVKSVMRRVIHTPAVAEDRESPHHEQGIRDASQ